MCVLQYQLWDCMPTRKKNTRTNFELDLRLAPNRDAHLCGTTADILVRTPADLLREDNFCTPIRLGGSADHFTSSVMGPVRACRPASFDWRDLICQWQCAAELAGTGDSDDHWHTTVTCPPCGPLRLVLSGQHGPRRCASGPADAHDGHRPRSRETERTFIHRSVGVS
jgi:hypothetical protein